MHKAKKAIIERLKSVDMVIEVLDARLPASSENPLLAKLSADKPKLKILNKQDLADPERTDIWLAEFQSRPHTNAIALDASDRSAAAKMIAACRKLVPHRKGIDKPLRVLICGIPNVGKSTLINTLAGRIIARTGNEAGVTKSQQRIKLDNHVILTDTPGFLWPKLNPPSCGYRLAITAAIKDTVFDYADIAMFAADYFIKAYPERIKARYQLSELPETEIELLDLIARQRGFMRKGGLADLHKASEILVNEFRSGMLGRISLETPEMVSVEIVEAEAEAEQKAREKAEREEERQARARRKYAKKRQR